MSIAGHVWKKMLQHYLHVRMDARRNALDALTMKPNLKVDSADAGESYDTNTGVEVMGVQQVVDLLVELSGIEPLASSLRTRRSPS